MNNALITLCFHGIGTPGRRLDPEEDHYWVQEKLFLSVLDEIADRLDVMITFDDGNVSDIEIGLPALLARGLVGAYFPLAGRLTTPGSLSSSDLRELRGRGMAIGSHGMDHRPWRSLDLAATRRELVEARAMLAEASDGPIMEAALPLGRYDRGTLASLRRLGYSAVHSSDRMRSRPGQWLRPRYSVTSTDTIETVRSHILAPPPLRSRVRAAGVGWVKRHR